ncbi:hypothetical protein JTB14_027698 [Gonioctena quinquepunctata]|nr:hypothetical protein JTB14_027698 [Gonioctena quinquepunctata]
MGTKRPLCNDKCVQGDEEQACQGIEEGCATQTDLTMSMLPTKLGQLEFASKKLDDLEKKVENTPLRLMDNIDDIHKWKYHTGFDYEFIKIAIFLEIEPHATSTSTTKYSLHSTNYY